MIKTSAPGSLMLMGEHAVLHDKLAICAAVDQRVHIQLQPRSQDNKVFFSSNVFTPYETTLSVLTIQKPYQFISAALLAYQAYLTQGCNITIQSDFLPTLGLGSSAAVTVACVAAIRQWLGLSLNLATIMQSARTIVRQVQGCGSGSDVAASTFGGAVLYRQDDLSPQLLHDLPELTAVYCGYKTPTVEVIHSVKERYKNKPEQLADLFERMNICTKHAAFAWEQLDWAQVGDAMHQYFQLQQELGVSDQALDHIVARLQAQSACYGSKISGSGLGDCAIALGHLEPDLLPDAIVPTAQQLSIKLSQTGVAYG
ncbi:MAG: mevalonate kinase [Gammaproteobacteria bacterium]|nr:mevalonate kinase [Gammaproteobacteria bacterium]